MGATPVPGPTRIIGVEGAAGRRSVPDTMEKGKRVPTGSWPSQREQTPRRISLMRVLYSTIATASCTPLGRSWQQGCVRLGGDSCHQAATHRRTAGDAELPLSQQRQHFADVFKWHAHALELGQHFGDVAPDALRILVHVVGALAGRAELVELLTLHVPSGREVADELEEGLPRYREGIEMLREQIAQGGASGQKRGQWSSYRQGECERLRRARRSAATDCDLDS